MNPRWLFEFPDPVSEVSARLVAAGVLAMALAALVFQQPWLIIVLALGFWARVLTGPKLSPLGLVVTKAITPRLPLKAKMVPGPPKRFAQGIGVVVTSVAALLFFGFGLSTWSYGLVGLLALFAFLESALAFCAGCQMFVLLMRLHVIPESACPECQNIWLRGRAASS